MAATVAVLASSEGKGSRVDIPLPDVELLERWGHIGDSRNATTAMSTTSTGLTISVTLCASRSPGLSYLSVDCPGLDLDPSDMTLAPKVVTTDGDLVLIRVPNHPHARCDSSISDYFVYRVHPERAKLDRLPFPPTRHLRDNNFAILSCGEGGYVVAGLQPYFEVIFTLHRYRSAPNGALGSWTSLELTVETPLREKVCPIPKSSLRVIFHDTTKVITLGGAKGTIGWVDLWRGIVLCDVLDKSPKLYDMPLPIPSKGNWSTYLTGCPRYSRDIVVNQSRDTIKYVEMEFNMDTPTPAARSYHEWLACQERPCHEPQWLVPGSWKATIWSMPIPVSSWNDWKRQCFVSSKRIDKIAADIKADYKLLCTRNKWRTTGKYLCLNRLHMAYPALSIADDVVYMLSKGTRSGTAPMIFSVNLKAHALQGLVEQATRYRGFMLCYLSSGISKHLKPTGNLCMICAVCVDC